MNALGIEVDRYRKSFFLRIGSFSQKHGKFTVKVQLKAKDFQVPRVGAAMRRNLDKLIVAFKEIVDSSKLTISKAPSDLFLSPLMARSLRPPAVTPATTTSPPKKKEDPELQNLKSFVHYQSQQLDNQPT
jgi:hypothetical protein